MLKNRIGHQVEYKKGTVFCNTILKVLLQFFKKEYHFINISSNLSRYECFCLYSYIIALYEFSI